MTDQEIGKQPIFTWQNLLDEIRVPLRYPFSEGPWSGTYLPPITHRSETFWFEVFTPRLSEIDFAAIMSSVDHIHRALEWGFPNPDVIVNDPDYELTDAWACWVSMGRGDAFSFAALTHEGDRELGAAYFRPTEDGDDPYETGLQTWTVEEVLRDDLDIVLLNDVLAWIEADWALDRVVYYTPEAYERGLEVAAAAGLRRVDRKTSRSNYACFEWVRA